MSELRHAEVNEVRRAVVAGSFYPGSPGVLADAVDSLLAAAPGRSGDRRLDPATLRGIVVPHAGYQYSGPVAATAYAMLPEIAPPPTVVVILGPSHFEPLHGLVVAPEHGWSTPLGQVVLDDNVRRELLRLGAVRDARPHRDEHSIEVQLPFLQRCLPGVPVLPVAVGPGSPRVCAEMLVGAMPEGAMLVVSTDLSHYHDSDTARRLDGHTAEAVERRDLEELNPSDACGVEALRVALAWARLRGFGVRLLDLRNSADTAGDPGRVVGYGAFAITDEVRRG